MKVKQGANVVAEYRYDGVNRRIRKFTEPDGDNWTVREFYYNSGWQLLETRKQTQTRTGNPLTEPALATTLHKQYVWGIRYIDAPVLLWRDAIGNGTLNETLYYTTDANFNVTAVVNTSGQAVERYMYDPYGKVTILNGASGVDKDGEVTEWTDDTVQASDVANNILFCGYYRDAETGLYHVRNRYHHPTLGRWIQRDPIGYADGMNLYEYVGSNPCNYLDPDGLKWGSSDFVKHYWTGGGKNVDLGDVGLLDDWKTVVASDLKKLETSVFLDGGYADKASCEKEGSFQFSKSGRISGTTFTPSGTDRRHNMSDPMYSIGGSTVHADYKCTVTRECECCNDGSLKEVSRTIECTVNWTLDDLFSNPLDEYGLHYTRDEKAYSNCISECRSAHKRCSPGIGGMAWARLTRTKRKRCRRKYNKCVDRCNEKYPNAELQFAQKYKITGSWSSTITRTKESPCE